MTRKEKMIFWIGPLVVLTLLVTQIVSFSDDRLNVILISVDTLRPDVLGCYNPRSSLTPNMDRFARKGVVFENAISVAPWTIPAHMSMFTGLYPTDHKMNTAYDMETIFQKLPPLSPHIKTLGEIFKGQGYSCAAFTGGVYVMGAWGFARGFDVYDNQCMNIKTGVQKLIPWLRDHKHEKFFVFLHTYVMHAPYPKSQEIERFSQKERYRVFSKIFHKIRDDGLRRNLPNYGTKEAEEIFSYYKDSAIYLDKHLGVLFDYLEKNGFLKNTLVLLLSDHGDEFYEHHAFTHGHTLYGELLHVPLILYDPRSAFSAKRFSGLVSNIDVFATLCEILQERKEGPGLSLFQALKGTKNRRFVFSESIQGPELKSLTTEQYKLILNTAPGKYPFPWKENDRQWQFYDLQKDPQELHDQAELNAPEFLRLRTVMQKLLAPNGFQVIYQGETAVTGEGKNPSEVSFPGRTKIMSWIRSVFSRTKFWGRSVGQAPIRMDDSEVEKLKSLGYL